MTKLLIILALWPAFSFAASCPSNGVESRLAGIFSHQGRPTSWTSVRQGSFERDRSFPITVYVTYRINTSRIVFRRTQYDLSEASFCNVGSARVSIQHPKGNLEVYRTGTGSNSVVHLKQKGGPFKFKLRPSSLVN